METILKKTFGNYYLIMSDSKIIDVVKMTKIQKEFKSKEFDFDGDSYEYKAPVLSASQDLNTEIDLSKRIDWLDGKCRLDRAIESIEPKIRKIGITTHKKVKGGFAEIKDEDGRITGNLSYYIQGSRELKVSKYVFDVYKNLPIEVVNIRAW